MTTTPIISYHKIRPDVVSKSLERVPVEYLQKALMAASIACAILALIPSIGMVGSLSLRSVACLSAGLYALHALKQGEPKGMLLLHITRLAAAALGLAGVATHLYSLSVAALVLGIGIQTLEAASGLHKKDLFKSLMHFNFIMVDAFMLTAMLTGAWPYIVVASTLSSVAMFVLAGKAIAMGIKEKNLNAAFDSICYLSLGILGIASAVRSAEILYKRTTRYYYHITNDKKEEVTIYDKHGNAVVTIAPGETVDFNLDPKNTYDEGRVLIERNGDKYSHYYRACDRDTITVVVQSPMKKEEFPYIPVGTPSLITEDPCLFPRQKPTMSPEQQTLLRSFLDFELSTPFRCRLLDDRQPIFTLTCEGGQSVQFNKEEIARQSGYIQGLIGLDPTRTELNTYLDPTVFSYFTKYLLSGVLDNVGTLEETLLIELHNYANFYTISSLEKLCVKEIAHRLSSLTWKNSSLFEQARQQDMGHLSQLVALFDFTK